MKTRKSLRVFSLSASSLVVYYLSTQCYKQRTTLVQPWFVVRSLRILNSLLWLLARVTRVASSGFRLLGEIPAGAITVKSQHEM